MPRLPMRRAASPSGAMRRLRPPPAASSHPSLPPTTSRRIELIIKLGGSCLTVKTQPHTIDRELFSKGMDTIARLHSLNIGFILVHGAGSFGHFEAHKHCITAGTASPLGVSETHSTVTKLNTMIVDALIQRNIPAVGVSPLLVPAKTRADFIAALLDRGHVPVLHGDTVYAEDGRTAILSGDGLMASLVRGFELVTRVVFLSDVPGVLTNPPQELENLTQAIVKRVTVNESGQVDFNREIQTNNVNTDVTGGIMGKVAAAAKCVSAGKGKVVAFICGVGTDAAEMALLGNGGGETWIRLECTRVVFEG